MNSLFEAGLEIQNFLNSKKWPFCFIGKIYSKKFEKKIVPLTGPRQNEKTTFPNGVEV